MVEERVLNGEASGSLLTSSLRAQRTRRRPPGLAGRGAFRCIGPPKLLVTARPVSPAPPEDVRGDPAAPCNSTETRGGGSLPRPSDAMGPAMATRTMRRARRERAWGGGSRGFWGCGWTAGAGAGGRRVRSCLRGGCGGADGMDTGGTIDAAHGDDTTTGRGPAANDADLTCSATARLVSALPALDALIPPSALRPIKPAT